MVRTLIAACLAVPVIFSFGCVPYWTHQRVVTLCEHRRQMIDGLEKEHTDLKNQAEKANAERDTYKFDNERLNEIAKANEQLIEAYKERMKKFIAGLRQDVQAAGLIERGVTITDEGTIAIEGEVLFAPGRDVLKKEAKAILARLVPVLQKYQGCYFRIDGHTDNQPIKVSPFKTNFHLGAMRAHAVLMELKNLGIPEEKMYIASYSEYRPAVPNAPNKGGAKQNRRVEIAVVKTAR